MSRRGVCGTCASCLLSLAVDRLLRSARTLTLSLRPGQREPNVERRVEPVVATIRSDAMDLAARVGSLVGRHVHALEPLQRREHVSRAFFEDGSTAIVKTPKRWE